MSHSEGQAPMVPTTSGVASEVCVSLSSAAVRVRRSPNAVGRRTTDRKEPAEVADPVPRWVRARGVS